MEDLKRTGGEAWEDLRRGAEAALDELKKGVEGAVAKLKKVDPDPDQIRQPCPGA